MRRKTEDALADWLGSLATQKDTGERIGFTTREAAKAWGVCEHTASRRILAKIEEGQIRHQKAPRMQRTGVSKATDVYVPVKGKGK